VPLLLSTGLWLGLVEVVALAWLGRLAGRLAAATAIRRPEWIFAVLSSILLSPLYVWGTLQLFSGAGIRRSSLAGAGPWVVIPLTCLALIGAFRLFGRLRAQPPRAKRVIAVLPLALAIGAFALDWRWLPDGYRYLHNTAAIVAVVLVQAALDLGQGFAPGPAIRAPTGGPPCSWRPFWSPWLLRPSRRTGCVLRPCCRQASSTPVVRPGFGDRLWI